MYKDIPEVPKALRSLDSYALSIDQINMIVKKANKLKGPKKPFGVALYEAKQEFKERHKPSQELGIWVHARAK